MADRLPRDTAVVPSDWRRGRVSPFTKPPHPFRRHYAEQEGLSFEATPWANRSGDDVLTDTPARNLPPTNSPLVRNPLGSPARSDVPATSLRVGRTVACSKTCPRLRAWVLITNGTSLSRRPSSARGVLGECAECSRLRGCRRRTRMGLFLSFEQDVRGGPSRICRRPPRWSFHWFIPGLVRPSGHCHSMLPIRCGRGA